ncbi:MAG TPA: hypothetical protein VF846_21790 [Thermoanaerobaculia bacterium]
MKNVFGVTLFAALAAAAPLFAQSTTDGPTNRPNDPAAPTVTAPPPAATQPRIFRSELRMSVITFSNFFQVPDEQERERVNAAITQYRAYVKPWKAQPLEFFGHVDFQRYINIQRENSYGGGVGVTYNGERHQGTAFLDRGENRAAFDIGDQTAIANVTVYGIDYSFRATKNWELELDWSNELQRFSVQTGNENDYRAIGVGTRYRGFGYKFSPRVGYVMTERESRSEADSFEGNYWYVGFVSAPHPRVYLSLAYRDHVREYGINNPASPNFNRRDDRGQIVFAGVVRLTDHLGLSTYYSREAVESTRPGRDFDADYLIVGLNYGF